MAKKPNESVSNWLELGVDFANRTIMLDSEVDEDSAGLAIRALHTMESQSSDPITFIISTYGGGCYEGLALYDSMRSSSCNIITIGTGKVMSMGTILMLGGDYRTAHKNTTFMFHSVTSGSEGKLFHIETDIEETKRIFNTILDIYASRTKTERAYFQRWLRFQDRYTNTEKAKELGFIQEIIEID